MEMRQRSRLHIVVAVIMVCAAVLGFSTSTGQDRKPYTVETQVYGVPAYQSDAARAIEAYERLMERYLDLSERNFIRLAADVEAFKGTLNAIDARLSTLDARLARIEQHLGIPTVSTPDPNALLRSLRPGATGPVTPEMP